MTVERAAGPHPPSPPLPQAGEGGGTDRLPLSRSAGEGVGERGLPNETLLDVRSLTVQFQTRGGALRAVNDVSFGIGRGKILAVLGESGSGKSMLLKTILGIQGRAAAVSGELLMNDTNLLTLSPKQRQEIRGSWVSM